MSERSYPITPRPVDDPRFTRGVAVEVAEVLARHGYPPITSGRDFLELQMALFGFLYGPTEAGKVTGRPAGEITRPEAVESCGKCRTPFDPADTRFDGHAREGGSPFCRRCVDRCHESTDAFHECAVCRERDDAPADDAWTDWQHGEQLAAADPQDIADYGRDTTDGGEGRG